jgi:hypothetical protein
LLFDQRCQDIVDGFHGSEASTGFDSTPAVLVPGTVAAMVAAFFTAFFQFTAIAVVTAIPVLVLARRTHRPTGRRFLIGAGACGLICGILGATSKRLVDQCLAAGNPTCVDYGTTGMQVLTVAGYALVALLGAYRLWR